MLTNSQNNNVQVRCVFQQGTPLREYVIIQFEDGDRVEILQISEEVFDFLVSAGIPVCEPVMVPPGSLTGQNLLCVFRADLGTQTPIPFVVTRKETTGEVSIIQITDAVYDFFRAIDIPVCLLRNAV